MGCHLPLKLWVTEDGLTAETGLKIKVYLVMSTLLTLHLIHVYRNSIYLGRLIQSQKYKMIQGLNTFIVVTIILLVVLHS